jgi:hypothetical protein
MTQKEQILELIKKEQERIKKLESNMFRRFFMTKGDLRWFNGIVYGLENLEDLIETEIKDN